jgi:hypothetical protein
VDRGGEVEERVRQGERGNVDVHPRRKRLKHKATRADLARISFFLLAAFSAIWIAYYLLLPFDTVTILLMIIGLVQLAISSIFMLGGWMLEFTDTLKDPDGILVSTYFELVPEDDPRRER